MMKKLLATLLLTSVPFAVFAQKAADVAPSQMVPLQVFGEFPNLERPRISPGGKVIAAKVRLQGKQALAILPLGEGGKPVIVAKDGEFDKAGSRTIRNWTWIDDDNLIITFSSRENYGGDWFDAGRLVGYNRTTKKTTQLGWEGTKFDGSNILWMSHKGPPTLLVQRIPETQDTERFGNPEVIKIDVLTGRQEVAQRVNPVVGGWYADGNGVVRVGTGGNRDTGKVLAIYRPDAKTNYRTIIDQKQERYGTLPYPQIFLKQPGKAIAMSRKDGYRAAYELDLDTMKLGKQIYGVKGYDIDGVDGDLEGDELEAVYVTEKRSKAVYFEPRLKELQGVLEETFGKGNVSIASADRAREVVVAHVGGPDQAGSYYVYDARTGGVSRLGYVNNTLKDARMNPVSTIRYKASDGKEIEAIVTMPRLKAGQKNLPLIINPHGGPWARDNEEWNTFWAQPLAEMGYVVIQPNFRGSDGYGKDWEAASDGNWGYRMQDDLNDAITHLSSQGIVDRKRVCMMGWSYGGYAASRAAQRDGDKFKCAITGAGVHDLPDMVSYDKDYLGEYGAKTALGAAGKLIDVSPSRHAKDYSIPLLIIHGEKDQRVPVAQSRTLVSRLKGAGKVEGRDFYYVEIPRETHNLLLEQSRIKVLTEMKTFLDKYNPA